MWPADRTRHKRFSSAAVAGLVFLSGCSAYTGYPKNYQDNAGVITADAPYLEADVITKYNLTAPADRTEYRNDVVYSRLQVIDINYYDFEAKLAGTYNFIGLGADLTVLVLNGLGATTGAAETKAALAAASAGVIGADASINKDVFYQKTVPALIAQMRADRQTALVTIRQGLTRSASEYSLDQALNDVSAYYVSGTLPSALSSVTAQAGAQLTVANDQLTNLRSVPYNAPTASAQQIIGWLYPGGNETTPIDKANAQLLADWMAKDTVDPVLNDVPMQDLLTGGGLATAEADRQRAIQALNIPEIKK